MLRERKPLGGTRNVHRLLPIYKLLRNDDRMTILWLLSQHEEPVAISDLQRELGLTVSSTSASAQVIRRYLNEMGDVGLVDIEQQPDYSARFTFNRKLMLEFVDAHTRWFRLIRPKHFKEASDDK